MIAFTVPGAPQGKGRPRVGKDSKGRAHMFTPEKTVRYEDTVRYAARDAMAGRALLEGACAVTMDIACQVPASWSAKKQKAALDGRVYPTKKPDVDNTEKIVFDAMNGVVWKDDVQVVHVTKDKRYSSTPGVKVVVTELAQSEAKQ